MLWGLEIFFSISFGYELTSMILSNTIDFISKFCIGIPIGFAAFSVVSFIISTEKLLNHELGLTLTFIFAIASFLLKIINLFINRQQKIYINPVELVAVITAVLLIMLIFHVSYYYDGNMFRSAVFPDIGFHNAVVKSFVTGINSKRKSLLRVKHILVANKKLTYPFLPDFHLAVLMGTGHCPEKVGIMATSLFLVISLVIGFYKMSHAVTKSHFAAGLSLFLFIHLGGMGFREWRGDLISQKNDWIRKMNGKVTMWFHTVVHMIITQRSSCYSFPCVFWAVYLLVKAKNMSCRKMIVAGILVGVLPQMQTHAYLAMGMWSLMFCGLRFLFRKRRYFQLLNMFLYGCGSVFMAIPMLIPLASFAIKKNFFTPVKAWKLFGFSNPISFWWFTLGLFFVIAWFFVWPNITKRTLFMYIPSCIIFILSNVIKFQPWITDNVKVIHSGWVIIACPLVGLTLSRLVTKYQRRRDRQIIFCILVCVLLLFMSMSSFLAFGWALLFDNSGFNYFDVRVSLWLEENTSPTALFVYYPSSISPVTMAGRRSFLTSSTIAYSHGLIVGDQNDSVNMLCDFWDDINMYKRYKVHYVIDHSNDSPLFRPPPEFQFWHQVYSDGYYSIWKSNITEKV